jgi:small-conductance mechanosensitive channel
MFEIGGITFNTNKVIYIAVVIAVTVVSVRLVRFFINRYISKSSLVLKVDPTRYSFLKNALSFIIYTAALFIIVYSIPELRALSLTLFAGAGVLAAIIGFASQQAFSNIISGLFIVIFKPFRVGDVIFVGERYAGTVEDITMRHTVIRDFEHQRIIIPNSVISSETVVNTDIAHPHIRKHLHFLVPFDSDIPKVKRIIEEECLKHPLVQDYRSADQVLMDEPVVLIRVIAWEENGVKIRAYCWTHNFDDAWDVQCDLYERMIIRFQQEGIEVPYPHRILISKHGPEKKK